jgi:hypothetical protein
MAMLSLVRFGILGAILAVAAVGTFGTLFGFDFGDTTDYAAALTGGVAGATAVKILGLV